MAGIRDSQFPLKAIVSDSDQFVGLETLPNFSVASAAVVNGGNNYLITGEILTVVGGTGTAAKLKIETIIGDKVNSVTIYEQGSYTVVPTNPVSVTGGIGNSASFNLTTKQEQINVRSTALAVKTYITSTPSTTTLQQAYGNGSTIDQTASNFVSISSSPRSVSIFSIVAPGGGYAVGDILRVNGGVFTQQAYVAVKSLVAGTAVGDLWIYHGGEYTTIPANPVSFTNITGTGTGLTANFTYQATANFTLKNNTAAFNSTQIGSDMNTMTSLASFLTPGDNKAIQLPLLSEFGITYLTNQNPTTGQLGFRKSTNVPTFWNGLTWVDIVDGGAGFTLQSAYNNGSGINQVVGSDTRIKSSGLGINSITGITAPGTGYAVGDILTVTGGLFTFQAKIKVATIGAGGAVTSIIIYSLGEYITMPANPVFSIPQTGIGTGLQFTCDSTACNELIVENNGNRLKRINVGGVISGNPTTSLATFDSKYYNKGIKLPYLSPEGMAYLVLQSPEKGLFGYNNATDKLTYWNRVSFSDLAPVLSNSGLTGISVLQSASVSSLKSITATQNMELIDDTVNRSIVVKTKETGSNNPIQFESTDSKNAVVEFTVPTTGNAPVVGVSSIYGHRFTVTQDRYVTAACYPVSFFGPVTTRRVVQIYERVGPKLIFDSFVENTMPIENGFYVNTTCPCVLLKAGVEYVCSGVAEIGDQVNITAVPPTAPDLTILGYGLGPTSSPPRFPASFPASGAVIGGGFSFKLANAGDYLRAEFGQTLGLRNQNLEYKNEISSSTYVGDLKNVISWEPISVGDLLTMNPAALDFQFAKVKATDSYRKPVVAVAQSASTYAGQTILAQGLRVFKGVAQGNIAAGDLVTKSFTVNGSITKYNNIGVVLGVALHGVTSGNPLLFATTLGDTTAAYGDNSLTMSVVSSTELTGPFTFLYQRFQVFEDCVVVQARISFTMNGTTPTLTLQVPLSPTFPGVNSAGGVCTLDRSAVGGTPENTKSVVNSIASTSNVMVEMASTSPATWPAYLNMNFSYAIV